MVLGETALQRVLGCNFQDCRAPPCPEVRLAAPCRDERAPCITRISALQRVSDGMIAHPAMKSIVQHHLEVKGTCGYLIGWPCSTSLCQRSL